MMTFGLRSAPKAVANALEWVRGVTCVAEYLDDFITMGPPASGVCSNLQLVRVVFDDLGVPLAVVKIEGPFPCLTFLGIELDTQAGIMRIRDSLTRWATRKTSRRRELEFLVGTLQHACRVVKPGRPFLRRMIDLRLPSPTKGHHHIRLNRQSRPVADFCRALERVSLSGDFQIDLQICRRREHSCGSMPSFTLRCEGCMCNNFYRFQFLRGLGCGGTGDTGRG